jgi:hypothetical protein
MLDRNIFFPLASEGNGNSPGIRPSTDKMQRFNVMVPLFKARKMFFPVERKNEPALAEGMTELSLASVSGFKSKNDDFIDTVSMLGLLKTWRPSEEQGAAVGSDPVHGSSGGLWDLDVDDEPASRMSSYIV